MPTDVVMIGAGGFGREALDVIEAWNLARPDDCFRVLGVIDDAPRAANLERLAQRGILHLGDLEVFLAQQRDPESFRYFVGVGDPSVRARIVSQCDRLGWVASSVVHPSASVGSVTRMEPGTIICGGVQVSTNVRLGRHVHLNPGAVIGHDTTLGDFVSMNPGAIVSGDVMVEARVLVGAGAVVLQQLTLGADSTVGASACVTRDVPPDVIVKGVPARDLLSIPSRPRNSRHMRHSRIGTKMR